MWIKATHSKMRRTKLSVVLRWGKKVLPFGYKFARPWKESIYEISGCKDSFPSKEFRNVIMEKKNPSRLKKMDYSFIQWDHLVRSCMIPFSGK